MNPNDPKIGATHTSSERKLGQRDWSSSPAESETITGGDQDIDTAGTDADADDSRTLTEKSIDAADEAGSAFLPHDKVLDDEKL